MRFAALTFRIAGILGLLTLLPMYFLYGEIGRKDPPPLNHPHFYFGFLGVTLAWQILFLIVSTDPVRYRPIMIAAVLEKVGFVGAVLVLVAMKMVSAQQALAAVPDAIVLAFLVTAYIKTPQAYPAGTGTARVRTDSSPVRV